MWEVPKQNNGEERGIIVDLKCETRLSSFTILNGFGNLGIHSFSLLGSRNSLGPWTELYSGKLPRGLEMTEEVKKK